MKCQRCEGLMVKDEIFDPDGPYLHIGVLRCLNCGATLYINKEGRPVEDQFEQIKVEKQKNGPKFAMTAK